MPGNRFAGADESEVPSVYAAYRFSAKLRRYKAILDACIARVLGSLKAERSRT